MSRKAFTLAEILITLTVISVVAALTIPTLLQNTNQAELKTALKRDFADLSQATLSIKNDNGGSLVNVFRNGVGNALDSENLKNAFKDKLSYIKECRSTNLWGGNGTGASAEGCWHAANNWSYLNGSKITGPINTSGLVLSNGTLVYFEVYSSNCTYTRGQDSTVCSEIYFDVNGFKTPNTIGKDIFQAYITGRADLVPSGGITEEAAKSCDPSGKGQNCTALYLYQ